MIDMEKLIDISNCKTLDEYAIHQINMWQKLYEEKCNHLFEVECERDIAQNTVKRLIETLSTHITRTKQSWDRYDIIGFYSFENNPNRTKEKEMYDFINRMFKGIGESEDDEAEGEE